MTDVEIIYDSHNDTKSSIVSIPETPARTEVVIRINFDLKRSRGSSEN